MSESTAIPVLASCRLDAEARARRLADLRALLVPHLRGVERSPASRALTLDLTAGDHAGLARLLDAERECCPFWRFELSPPSRRPARLEVGVAPGHEPALDAIDALIGAGR